MMRRDRECLGGWPLQIGPKGMNQATPRRAAALALSDWYLMVPPPLVLVDRRDASKENNYC